VLLLTVVGLWLAHGASIRTNNALKINLMNVSASTELEFAADSTKAKRLRQSEMHKKPW
jgi:hypothetical protein